MVFQTTGVGYTKPGVEVSALPWSEFSLIDLRMRQSAVSAQKILLWYIFKRIEFCNYSMILLGKWKAVKILEYYIYHVKIPSHFSVHFLSYFQGSRNRGSTNLQNCAIIFAVRLCEPKGSFFSTALPLGFGRVVL